MSLVKCIPIGFDESILNNTCKISDDYINHYFDESYFNVVYAGTIGITNALDVFFKAVAEMVNQDKSIRFILVSDGALKQMYMERYSHLDNIVFAPKLPRKMVRSVLEKANVVYFSTFDSKVWKYRQSLNKVVDYMLSGKLIVASYGDYPSMINEVECGYFIPPDNVEALNNIETLYISM
ncbi:hypothetical protein ARAF_1624 [Arsenophonus endosymbiont of Aleurodicus floccissimus]|uniref:glycosyltransferase n=1 Tax=Arsenophonus endosymbiont of Aleurodicus floccissimus TaxID=2152761 RepID=UPI000E6B2F46|nr:glycosyltransferase [Arsenophonus endosymbiont of Aleurodicus floccissimus]SPP31956.1 hypothetical protein ARAF_1624 [Arsenophonus endosymbiont of Aleurodicus floccissimus]